MKKFIALLCLLSSPVFAGQTYNPSPGGVTTINGTAGNFTFTGSGQSCTGTTCTFNGGGGTLGTSVTATSPSISGDLSSGLYTPTGSSVAIATGGVEQFAVDPTGLVGIGTNLPRAQLEIGGNKSAAAWGTAGIDLRLGTTTFTDTTSSGTVATAVVNAIGTPTIAATSQTTFTSLPTLYITSAPAAGTNVTITNPFAFYVATGASLFNGRIGVGTGAAGALNYGIYEFDNLTSGANQSGLFVRHTFDSTGTTEADGIRSLVTTAPSAYTASLVSAIRADTNILGAGSTVTTNIGLDIFDQTIGTSNYGVRSQVTSGTSKYNFYGVGTAQNYFAGNVGIGSVTPQSTLAVVGSTSIASTSAMAISIGTAGTTTPVFNVDASTANAVSGISVKGAIAGGATIIQTTDPTANAPLTIAGKGTGVIELNSISGSDTFAINGTARLTVAASTSTFGPSANSASAFTHFIYTAPFDLNQTTATEVNNWNINTSASRAWAAGTVALQREIRVQQPTYTGAAATATFIEATSMSLDGQPIAGTNAAITQSEALRIGSGTIALENGGTLPVVSSCGSGSITTGSGTHKGVITGISAATACTITFAAGQPLPAPQTCNASGSVAIVSPSVSAISATAVTFAMTAFTGTLYYQCW